MRFPEFLWVRKTFWKLETLVETITKSKVKMLVFEKNWKKVLKKMIRQNSRPNLKSGKCSKVHRKGACIKNTLQGFRSKIDLMQNFSKNSFYMHFTVSLTCFIIYELKLYSIGHTSTNKVFVFL
jgi:hypothetical protein